jgi:lysophospholipase L1-like esterase
MVDASEPKQERSRGRAWPKSAALALASLGLALGACEIAVRVWQERLVDAQIDALGIQMGAVEAETWQPWLPDDQGLFHVRSANPRLVYENRPNARVAVVRGGREIVIETNSSGFRGDEFTREKPPGVYRIAVVGDSVTIGLFFERREIYPDLAERILNAGAPDRCRYQVYNLGVTGYNAAQEAELIRTRALLFDPDLIAVGYVFNDDELGQDAGLWAHFTRTRLRSFDFVRLRWLALEQRLRRTTLTERSFAELAEWRREHGIPILVIVFPLLDRAGGEYRHADAHARVRALAERSGFLVLDLLEAFAAAGTLDKDDGDVIHPTAEGHRAAARELAALVSGHPDLGCASRRTGPRARIGGAS